MRDRLLQIGGAVAVAASIAASASASGCGGDDEAAGLASMVPPDAPLYAELTLRPSDDQAIALEALAERVTGVDDLGAALAGALDESLGEDGVEATYADDVDPWLGGRGAFFVRSFEPAGETMGPDGALLLEVTDAEAAQRFLELVARTGSESESAERSYGGYDYRLGAGGGAGGLVGDRLVIGTEDGFKVAVDASEGESLAESDDYATRTGALGEDLIASLYLDPSAVIEAAIAAEGIDRAEARAARPLLGGPLSAPVAVGVRATPDSAELDLATAVGDAEPAPGELALLESLPSGSWLAVAVPELGPALQHALDDLSHGGLPGGGSVEARIRAATGIDLGDDVASWLGDATAFIRGTGVPGIQAGLVAETSDPEGPRRLVSTLQRLAEGSSCEAEPGRAAVEAPCGLRSAAPPPGAAYGFVLGIPGLGAGAEVGVLDGRLVAALATSVDSVLSPEQTLADDEHFNAAVELLGEDHPPSFYLDLPGLLAVAERGDVALDPGFRAALPYLRAFQSLIVGGRVQDDLLLTRLAVSLAPE